MSRSNRDVGSSGLGLNLDQLLSRRTRAWSETDGEPPTTPPPSPPTTPPPSPPTTPPTTSPLTSPAAGTVRQVPIADIVPNEFQPRRSFDEASLAALTESIRQLGVLQPILVRPRTGDDAGATPERFELIAGERRWRAARRAGLSTVPVIVRSVDDRRSLEEAIVENLHRSDLNPLEEAAAYQQLIDDFDLTQADVAARVGKSRPAVANILRLSQLPDSIKRLIIDGSVSAGHGRALLALPDRSAQRRLAQRAIDDDLSVRHIEELVKSELDGSARGATSNGSVADRTRRRSAEKSAAALEIEGILGDRFDTRVEVHETSGTGRIVINFADDDDLSRIVDLLAGD